MLVALANLPIVPDRLFLFCSEQSARITPPSFSLNASNASIKHKCLTINWVRTQVCSRDDKCLMCRTQCQATSCQCLCLSMLAESTSWQCSRQTAEASPPLPWKTCQKNPVGNFVPHFRGLDKRSLSALARECSHHFISKEASNFSSSEMSSLSLQPHNIQVGNHCCFMFTRVCTEVEDQSSP